MAEDFQKFSLIFPVWFQKWDLCLVTPTPYQFLIEVNWINAYEKIRYRISLFRHFLNSISKLAGYV